MKIGIFDSGLGGLVIARAIIKQLPLYDYVYLGDTARVPYGDRDQKTIFKFTEHAIKSLFEQDCQLVIVACNTASTNALRKIQREYLPKFFPGRRVLGVIIPTLESIGAHHRRIGVIGTAATVKSGIYKKELKKLWSKAKIFQMAAPKLVPMIENDRWDEISGTLDGYLRPLKKKRIDTLVLGCTHYPLIKPQARKILGAKVKIISQTDIIPGKLKNYLLRHPEIESRLSKKRSRIFEVTRLKKNFRNVAERLFGEEIKFNLIRM